MTQNLPCVVGHGLITPVIAKPTQSASDEGDLRCTEQGIPHPGICLEKGEKWVAIAATWLLNENLHEEAGGP